MRSDGGNSFVSIRHIKESELSDLSPDVREVIPALDDGRSIFMVASSNEYSTGRLARHGHWMDNNHILRPGVQYLVLQNVKVDVEALCDTILTVQTTYAQVEREMKMQKKQQYFSELKVEEEAVEDPAERPLVRRRGSSFRLNTALETEALVVENSVLSDADASILGRTLGSRNTLDLEGCHCTLKSLHLCNNMLRESGVEWLTRTLSHNTSVSNLYVGFNNIGDGGATAMFRANLSRTMLTTLKLGGNVIADQGLTLVPAFLESTSNLVVLHLNNNLIGDIGARYLAQGLALSESLQVLNLNGNRIRDPGLDIMSQALIGGPGTRAHLRKIFGNHPRDCSGHRGWAPNTSLKALHLASNWLRDPGADRIAAILEGNWNLTNLELASNRIGDEGARALADALRYSMPDPSNNKVPRKICLSCNGLSSIGLRELQIALAKSGNIHTISVEGMRCNVGRRAAVQKENAQVTEASFDARFPAQRLRLEAIRPTTPRVEQQASRHRESGSGLPSLKVHSARGAKEIPPSRGQMPRTPGRGNGNLTERYFREEDSNPKLGLASGLGEYLMMNLDDDPKFQALCQRLEVPVADMQRSKLKEMDARQQEQRTRIYDRFLDLHSKHPRPILNAAVRMQSLFKIRQSIKEAAETRARNEKRMRSKEGETVAAEAGLKSVDMIAKAAVTMLEPLLNRLWNAWKTYLEHARTMRTDVVDLYASMCTSMGITASGCMALKTYMGSPFDIKLDLRGLGMLPHSARALSFIFRGLNCCKLCQGVGIINSDAFLGVRSDYDADHRSAGEIFDLIDMDKSGTIDSYELSIAFGQMGVELTTEEVFAIMKQGDKSEDMLIDKQEFKDLFEKLKSGIGKSRCALCDGKGHSGEQALVEGLVPHVLVPVLKAREMLGYESLEQLHLSGNCLRQAGTADIVGMLIELKMKIKVLTLARNELGESGAVEIAKLFSCPDLSLVDCDISENALGDGGIKAIAESLSVCTTLLSLNLSKTACGSLGAQALGQMFDLNRSLTDLDVSWNGIGGVGAVAFCTGLANSRTLLRLSAQWNGFCDLHAMVALSETLAHSSDLKHLNLSQNRISNEGALVLAEGLKTNSNLLELVMSGNPLTVHGARSLLRCAQMGAGEADHLRSILLNNSKLGILDMSMFNPVEPSGRYSLDMENEYSRRVLRNVLKLIAEGRAEFEHEHVVQIMEVLRVDEAGNPVLHPVTGIQEHDVVSSHIRLQCFMNKQEFDARGETDADPLQWEIPLEGMIEFSLNDLGRRAQQSKLASTKLNLLRDEFRSVSISMENKMQSFHNALPGTTVISLAQFQVLLAVLRTLKDDSWLKLVTEGFYKVAGNIPARDILSSLEPTERKQAEKSLEFGTFEFYKSNPTGYYHLNLSNPKERRVAEQLVECKNAQAVAEKRYKEFSAGNAGGGRDLEQRAWRNAILDNKAFPFQRNLKIPRSGLFSLDFVQMTRTDPTTIDPMSDGYFKALVKEVSVSKDDPITQIQAMRLASSKQYFTVAQVSELMDTLKTDPKSCFQPRVELIVLSFARTVDWYALYHLVAKLLPFERRQVYHRIGHENIFEETMAVNYYELDLADSGQRYVAQQVIQLAINEPGENCIELMYEGCDFEVPASWTTSVPRSGQLRLYYAREKDVMDKVMKHGTSDIRKTNPFFYKSAFGDFLPKWIKPYCPKGYPQPIGKDWITAFKLRLVKSKIQEKVALDAREAFQAIDEDGSGELSRAELLMSLFRMGVWLHQSEANALVTTLDEDSTGLIDIQEFQAFWDAHTYD